MPKSHFFKFFPLTFLLLFAFSFDGISNSYFIQIHHKTQTVSAGEIIPKNKRKFKKIVWESDIDSTNFEQLSVLLKDSISIEKPFKKQLIHIHGMMGGNKRFMAENVVDFQTDILENDSLNFEHCLYILWDANHSNYFKDVRNAEADAPLLSIVFSELQNAFPGSKFTVQTHSLGAYFLIHSVRYHSFKKSPFQRLIMHAPDVSLTEFQTIQNQLLALFSNIHIFYHEKDLPLKISTRKNGEKRLGRNPEVVQTKGIEWIDCSKLKAKGLPAKISKHLHYRDSAETRAVVTTILAR